MLVHTNKNLKCVFHNLSKNGKYNIFQLKNNPFFSKYAFYANYLIMLLYNINI